jgi:GPH family glycoside/pentoside/hexuronide:cation symporter
MPATETQNKHPTVPPRQVSTGKRFLWGLGGATDFLTYNSLNGLMDAIYVNAMALDPKIIGLARSIPRLLDLATDPILGHLSDNTRSRWGRRRPWMAVGAILAAVIAILMWYPPLQGGAGLTTAYILGMSVILFTLGYSMFMIPYTAQGYELSTDYNERTHIFQWRLYAYAVIGFLGPWLLPLCLWLEGPMANVTRGVNGVHWVSVGIAAAILLTACGPIFGCREKSVHAAEKKTKFYAALRFTIRNKAFWPLVAANFLVKFGMVVTMCFFYYVMVYHVSGGDNKTGTTRLAIFYNSINITMFLAMALVVRFTDRIGKKSALMTLMLMSAVTYASVWFTLRPQQANCILGISSFLHNSCAIPSIIADIWPALITGACIGIFTSPMPLVMNSMLADVCDVDELACGQQRQAFYGAIFVTCDKLAMAMAMFLQGFLVSSSGYNAKLVTQTPDTMGFWMKALLFTQPIGFVLGFFCVLAYPITRAKALEVRHLLDARNAAHGTG